MAGEADGSIIIDTEIDSEGFKAGTARMQKAIASLTTSVNNLGPTFKRAMEGSASAASAFTSKAEMLRAKIAEIEEQMDELSGKQVNSQRYDQLVNEIQRAEASFDKMLEKQDKMLALGVGQESSSWKSLQYDIEQCGEKIRALTEEKKAMEQVGTATFIAGDSAQFEKLAEDLKTAKSALSEMEGEFAGNNRQAETLATHSGTIASHLKAAAEKSTKKLASGLRSVASEMWKVVTHSRGANHQLDGLISGAKKFALSLLGARGVYALLRRAVSEYMAQNQQLASTLSSCWSGIGNILGPIITRLINLVATAVAYVTSFLKLFGVFGKSATKAISSAGGAAAGAAKDLKKQLASFDELNILNSNDSGGGGGGGGAGADLDGTLADVELPDWVKLMVDQIKAGNWGEAGKVLADAINGLIDDFDFAGWGDRLGQGIQNGIDFALGALRNIHWENIGVGAGEFLNHLLDNVNPEDLGALLAQKIRIAVDLAYGFVTTFDWAGAGDWLAGVVNGWFEEIDWAKAGETVSKGVTGLLQSLNHFLATTDWKKIGEDIGDFLSNIDLGAIIEGIITAIGNLWQAFLDFFDGFSEKCPVIARLVEAVAIGFAAWKIGSALFTGITKVKDGLGKITGLFGSDMNAATDATSAASEAAGNLDGAVSGGFSPKLKSLAKNLLLGLAIIAEVVAAAALLVGGIALLGWELQLVAQTWAPVIEQGELVTQAMLIGTGILAAVGVITGALGSVGKTLIVNMALGIAILAEISVATDLFIGEIALMGLLLDLVGQAWAPVMANGDNIVKAIAIGTGILVAIGVVTAALGAATVATAGALPLAIGLGTAILVELSAAADLFLAEIWVIGKLLDEIGKAWQPVLDNGETIAEGIKLGTALLVAIGVVTAALGVATVASVGLLPAAIALGTGLLVELAAAFVAFSESLIDVAGELSDNLAPALESLDAKLPGLSSNMSKFVDFMSEFAGHVVRYTEVSTISALAGTIDTIIGWFTEDPIQKLANDVNKTYEQASNLNVKLELAVPELEKAVGLLSDYQKFIGQIKELTDGSDNTVLSGSVMVNMKKVGENMVTGFVDGMKSKSSSLKSALDDIENTIKTFKKNVEDIWKGMADSADDQWTQIKSDVSTRNSEIERDTTDKWNAIKRAVDTAGTNIQSSIKTKFAVIRTTIQSAWKNVGTDVDQYWKIIKNSLGTTFDAIQKTAKEKFNLIRTNAKDAWNGINTDAGTAWDTIKTTVTGKADSIQKSVSSAFQTAKTNVINRTSEMAGTIGDYWRNIASNAYSWGSDMVRSMASGINDNKWRVSNAASSVASAVRSYLHFSEPDIGPLSDFHTYGPDMVKELAKGIDDNRGVAAKSASGIAKAISNELTSGEYEIQSIAVTSEIDGVMDRFADRMAQGFENLMARLQAIADGVSFRMPTAVNSLIPYQAAATADADTSEIASSIESSNEEMISVVNQVVLNATAAIVAAIERYSGAKVTIDERYFQKVAVEGINRRARMDAKSPLDI